jgi:hypothetical protein
MFLHFINEKISADFHIYVIHHILLLFPPHPTPLSFPNYPYNSVQTHIQPHTYEPYSCLPVTSILLSATALFKYPSSALPYYFHIIFLPFFFNHTLILSPAHSLPTSVKHSQDHLFTMLLTLTIPPFIPFQIPSPNTPSFKYLHITNSLHHTSCYYINTHHSFGTKLLTLPIFSYPYHLFIPSHIAHIFPPITNIFILRAHLSKHSPTNYFLSHSLLSTTNYLYHLPLLYIEP